MVGAALGWLNHEARLVCGEYSVLWKRQEIDLAELAKLRWADNLTVNQLARYFGKS